MNSSFKKTFNILAKDPVIMLLFIVYLIAFASFVPIVFAQAGKYAFFILSFLWLLLTAAFFSGWFGMIKAASEYKEKEDPEEDLKNKYNLYKTGFFASIPNYMLSLVFYILLFAGFCYLIFHLTDYFLGKPDEIIKQLASVSNNQDALLNFIQTMPETTKMLIIKRSAFLYTGFLVYFLLTFYSVPALFFNCSINPLKGLKNGLAALFKKPLLTLGLFTGLLLTHILIIFFERISVGYNIVMFLALILRVYFIVASIVLIFSVYEKNFASNCNNGCNSVGEDGSCN